MFDYKNLHRTLSTRQRTMSSHGAVRCDEEPDKLQEHLHRHHHHHHRRRRHHLQQQQYDDSGTDSCGTVDEDDGVHAMLTTTAASAAGHGGGSGDDDDEMSAASSGKTNRFVRCYDAVKRDVKIMYKACNEIEHLKNRLDKFLLIQSVPVHFSRV